MFAIAVTFAGMPFTAATKTKPNSIPETVELNEGYILNHLKNPFLSLI